MNDAINRFADWLRRPYSSEMSAIGWFAFFGLIIGIVWAWATIVRKIETA